MRAIGVVPTQREVRLIDHPEPGITRDTQVKIKSLDVGICGTDKEICTFVYGSPPTGFDYLVLGHESLGMVTEVGTNVSAFKKGDLVVPSVRRPCSNPDCIPCRAALQDFCSTGNFTERGIKETHGFMTDFYVEDQCFLSPVPAKLRDIGVLVEPLTVAEKAIAQVWSVQRRFPWTRPSNNGSLPGTGLRAVVMGAGPVGILGAMKLVVNGFQTFVYSRSPAPNPKSALVESIGAQYISSESCAPEQLAERVGNIDLVYEAIGVSKLSFDVLKYLGQNGIFVFTGIPAPKAAIGIEADIIMRNVVLKNQVVLGTVNADPNAFRNAIADLETFLSRWPDAIKSLISSRHAPTEFRDLLLSKKSGIKNVISFD